ncbi:hypothetical protein C7447_101962 [Tenacibaculum adriaticum]|uniref:Transposase n=1 Tax=Tenacibaculum adriaticum TaxID=413713 RepID=A0A5S5E0V1_9FLAO|nr:hypothetical protein [Tenacibaculum adriaticum]TYQ00350.1 hypothetical protein C7447_101962 [Tenacibaculum adriaticum]
MINKNFVSQQEFKRAFPNEQVCIYHLEGIRWNKRVISPFDPSSKVYKCKGNNYKCKSTGKYFNIKTATIFESSKLPLQKWFLAIWLITSYKKDISTLQLSIDLDINQKSALFVLQRIKKCFEI